MGRGKGVLKLDNWLPDFLKTTVRVKADMLTLFVTCQLMCMHIHACMSLYTGKVL